MNEPKPRTVSNPAVTTPRFFVAPPLDDRLQTILSDYTKVQEKRSKKRMNAITRYAAYMRISSEEQVGNYSIEAQQRAIETWVQVQGGQLVKSYIDEAHSGRRANRPAFIEMRQDARQGKFDALVVHKFDRFARNRTDALAIKSLLRYDYNIKVFSVTEPSEDSDGPIGALIEGIMECVAEWYSRNLAEEVAKGRREKSTQGYHNCVTAPFGYKKQDKLLVPEESEVEGVRLAFTNFATGTFSYKDIAQLLNEYGYKSKTGRVFTKDTVREILRNEIYIGKVRYQETRYNSDGTRNFLAPVEWFDGHHEPLIETELFERCQKVRQGRNAARQNLTRYQTPYVLQGLVYCHRCCSNPPENADFPSWGKMFCQTRIDVGKSYYRCSGRAAGFHCEQGGVNAPTIDEQVISVLMQLRPPEDWRNRIISTMGEILGERKLEERLAEIRSTIERMDFRWDQGFITDRVDYLEKRLRLQQELEELNPVQEELDTAANLLENFEASWEICQGDIAKQHQLVKLIVERAYIEDDRVVAVTLKSDYHVVLGHKTNEPTYIEVDPYVHRWALRDLNP